MAEGEVVEKKTRSEKRYSHRSNTEPTGSKSGRASGAKGDTGMSQQANSSKAAATADKKPTPAEVNNSPKDSGPGTGESPEMGMHTRMVQDMTQRHSEELKMIHTKHAKEYSDMAGRGAALLGPGGTTAAAKAEKTSPPKGAVKTEDVGKKGTS